MKKYIILSSFLIVAFIACDKEDSLITRGQEMEGAAIKVLHLSPDAPSFNLYVDSLRAATVLAPSANTESGLAFGSIVPSLSGGYAKVPGGAHTVSVRVPSTSLTYTGQTLFGKAATLQTGKFYTIAVIDSLTAVGGNKLDAVIVEDDLSVPDTSKAYFRIANFMVRGSADVEFTGTAGGYNFMKNGIPYKDVTKFDTITPATYKILLRAASTTTRLDSITAFAPTKGRKYTLYVRGVVGQPVSSTRRPLIFQMTNY